MKKEKAVILSAIVVALLFVLIWPLGLLPLAHVDINNRLIMEDDSYSFRYMSADDYSTTVISGHGQHISSASIRLIPDSTIPEDTAVRCYMYDANGNLVLDESISLYDEVASGTLSSGDVVSGFKAGESGIYNIPFDMTLESGMDYQFIVAPLFPEETDLQLGIYCLRNTTEPALVLHEQDTVSSSVWRFLGVEKLCLCLLGLMIVALIIAQILKKKEPGEVKKADEILNPMWVRVSWLSLVIIAILAYGQYLVDHAIESDKAMNAGIMFLIGITVIGVVTILFPNKRTLQMIVMIGACGIAFMTAMPLGLAADEPSHFYRAYQAAYGQIFATVFDDGLDSGGVLPAAIMRYFDPEAAVDFGDTIRISFQNTAIYAPVCYIPQMIGIRLAAVFTNRVVILFWAARIAGFIFALAAGAVALRLIPCGRGLMFAVMMMPMYLQGITCISGDCVTNSLSLLFMAYVLRLVSDRAAVRRKELIILTLMCSVISVCKIVYFIMILLLLLIDREQFAGRQMNGDGSGNATDNSLFRDKAVHARLIMFGVPILVCAIANALFGRAYVPFGENMIPADQVKYVLTHIPDTAMTVLRSIIEYLGIWFQTMSGDYLGSLNIRTLPGITVMIAILLACAAMRIRLTDNLRNTRTAVCLGMVCLLGVLLIMGSLYVSWNVRGDILIKSIQGRYYIPFLVPLGLLAAQFNNVCLSSDDLARSKSHEAVIRMTADAVLVLLNMLVVTDIYTYLIMAG